MKLVMVRDGIIYKLGVACTFQLCITGRLPSQMNMEPDIVERLLALLEQTGFFKQMAAIFKTVTNKKKESLP